jgi:hypothetical protein
MQSASVDCVVMDEQEVARGPIRFPHGAMGEALQHQRGLSYFRIQVRDGTVPKIWVNAVTGLL